MKHLHKLVYILLKNGYTKEAKELIKIEYLWGYAKGDKPDKNASPFQLLLGGFGWNETPQGNEYWKDVAEILQEIG